MLFKEKLSRVKLLINSIWEEEPCYRLQKFLRDAMKVNPSWMFDTIEYIDGITHISMILNKQGLVILYHYLCSLDEKITISWESLNSEE